MECGPKNFMLFSQHYPMNTLTDFASILHTLHWVTLCFAKTKVLNSSFKPKLNLDTKIQFQTNAQFDFGFKPSLKPSFRSTAILKKLT